jgi:hypothetical protein
MKFVRLSMVPDAEAPGKWASHVFVDFWEKSLYFVIYELVRCSCSLWQARPPEAARRRTRAA